MCRRTLYALAFLICSVYADPRIIWLYNYDSGSTQNIVPVENGAKLHVASNDNVTLLQNIKIDAGLGAVSLDQVRSIADFKVSSNQLIITSTLDPPTSATLTGFIYVTTAAQANDNTFSVTTVDDLKTLSITSGKSTSVVLNTQFTTTHIRPFNAPDKTTYVTNVQQFGSTSLNFHYGYPNDTVITTNQFFENPQYIDNYDDNGEVANKTRVFFAHVEPIQVNLPYWYITADGPFNIYLDNIYSEINLLLGSLFN
ncbi:IgGFc_binding domain-containing protein [Caenorhabditis elegans]|uniref:IgGFc_binding domain-containing protein n=1 Tax=Caenorhabditis elegans TaxID=6239 RepID=U4PAV5_CAEEL|nr:IgGFc_binding domain-containing protein [Caenorhabditis elegans]CDH93016.1 IgGFc_binding domain-containing protein [Caenorhabditis elegans]|eukprot:NP_001294314.1 Uncharacterized protein CELE_C34H4.3 [Caenorhabditis elegans]